MPVSSFKPPLYDVCDAAPASAAMCMAHVRICSSTLAPRFSASLIDSGLPFVSNATLSVLCNEE